MIKYFKGIKSRDELRKAYLQLMKRYHPDCGGDKAICQEINNEYDYLSKTLPVENSENSTKQSAAKEIKLDEAIKNIINKIIHMAGIDIEICGSWVWVSGNSYKWKEELKKLGFKWSSRWEKWYFTPYDTGYRRGGNYKNFNTIRNTYGSLKVDTVEILELA